MRRFFLVILLFISACAPLAPLPAGTPAASPTPSPNFSVRYHPDGPLYVGDQVSLEVLAPSGFDTNGQTVRVELDGRALGTQNFQPFGIGGRSQATFFWAWDTAGLETGAYTLTFSVSEKETWTETVDLLPAAGVPYPEPDARWESLTTDCCILHYITGTAAARDLETLAEMAQTQAGKVEARFGAQFDGKIPLTFLPRVLGHGGFASDGIYVSYLDQNYAGSTTAQVTHHEMVHWLDAGLGGEFRPSILVEGLAVYLSGGHFKEEPLLPRAAALLDLGWYIPLRELTDAFYTSQHEIGYLEAAALVAYLVETHGWENFETFYRDIHPAPDGAQASALEAALQTHFGLTLAQLEANFVDFLQAQTVAEAQRTDLRLSVAFYDTVRHYQQLYDPSAYFLTAWLPDFNVLRQKGLVADILRHPQAAHNQQIEARLVAAEADLRAGHYPQAEANLRAAQALIEVWKNFKP